MRHVNRRLLLVAGARSESFSFENWVMRVTWSTSDVSSKPSLCLFRRNWRGALRSQGQRRQPVVPESSSAVWVRKKTRSPPGDKVRGNVVRFGGSVDQSDPGKGHADTHPDASTEPLALDTDSLQQRFGTAGGHQK